MLQMKSYLKAYHPIVHLLLLGTIFISLTSSMSVIYLPIYLMNSAKLDPITLGFIVGAGALTATIGGFLGGTLSDFFGRNRLMRGTLIVLGFIFIGFIFTSNTIFLFILNSLRGLFSTFFLAISKALIADLTPKEKRFRVFSDRYMAWNIGYSVGPIIGTVLGVAGNKIAFILTAVIYLSYFLLMSVLTRFITKSEQNEKISEKITFSQAWIVFRNDKVLLLFIIGSTLFTAVHAEMSVTFSQYLKMNFTDGVKFFGYLMSINGITVILTQVFISRWSERFGILYRIALGGVLFAIGEVGFAFSNSWMGLIISMIIFTFGEILIIPSEYAQIDEITPYGMRGMYYGAQGFSEIGNFIGPWFGGILLHSFGGKIMFLTFSMFSLLSIAFYFWGRKLHLSKQTFLNKSSTIKSS
ncbi:MDR family MFS transporter [Robertmurraya kyonggiensis]|uniref:MFS transporter n=1 Tax=Robertmurraya kyonggiensis TaxID=1037680 RepID=A0A4U1D9W4_9BACI|nr:MFS transporter [Robertmurraya kyonggiensis]TKC18337.1 MFS transporter [Robertmurraya kyonggiensis]